MKRFKIILITLLIAGSSLFFVYQYQQKSADIDVWSLVPENAVAVYESYSTVHAFNDVVNSRVWQELSTIPFYDNLKIQFVKLDSITGKSGSIDKLLRNQPFLTSLHVTSRNDFDYIFYFKIRNIEENEMINRVISSFEKNASYTTNERTFLSQVIYEVKQRNSNKPFSYFFYKDHFIGSYTPFLVEDAIRNIDNKREFTFINNNSHLKDVTKIQHDAGNLYIDFRRLHYLFNAFNKAQSDITNEQLNRFCQSTFLDLSINDEEVLFNGFSYAPPDSMQYYLNTFQKQDPAASEINHLIPNRTAILFHYAFSDPLLWQQKLNKYWSANNSSVLKKQQAFTKKYDINFSKFLSWIDNEVGYAIMESVDLSNPDKLIYIKTKDVNEAFNQFTRLAERINTSAGDTLYYEQYSNAVIKQINMADFPSLLLGSQFNGFENSFFTAYRNYIIIGNNIPIIKSLITDIENEEVWSKSIQKNNFLEKIMDKANYTVIADTERSWNLVFNNLNPKWKSFASQFGGQIRNFGLAAFQVSNIDEKYYTSIALQHQKVKKPEGEPKKFIAEQEVFTDAKILSKPWVVRNHADRSFEVLLQDSLNQLYLISSDGNFLWKKNVESKIKTNIHQLDFYNNGKLQYIFATENQIHIYDRNGDAVENYPFQLADSINIEFLSLIDYDNSKRYRFLIADETGSLYMFNKNQVNLDGWNPNKLDGKLAFPATHLRVRGKDCMIAVERSGKVHIMNRRGQYYDGFPLQLNAEINSKFFVDQGSTFEKTIFTTIDKNGMIVKFNLNGETIKTKQLYKPTKETVFQLIEDALSKTYIFVRQDFNRLSMLDRDGNVILEKDYITSDDLNVQYYYLGSENEIFAVTDQLQEFTYIYDNTGELINYQPIESGFEVGLLYSDLNDQYKVYSNYQNRFSILSFYR